MSDQDCSGMGQKKTKKKVFFIKLYVVKMVRDFNF